MKTNFTRIKTAVIATFLALFLSANLYAQPANDDCVNAIAVTVGTDEATCVSSSGSTVGGTPSTEPLSVCSGSWFGDDIWFSFETGATIPADGLTIKAFYGTEPGDLGQAGMGLYASCDVNESPLLCFSDGPGRTTLEPYACQLIPNNTYYVRIWSAPGANDNSGALRLCVFNSEPTVDVDVVLWGANPGEGDFDGGLNAWTIVNDMACDSFDLWRYNVDASAIGGSFGDAVSSAPSACNGAMVFYSDLYDSGGPNGPGECPAPHTGELISPSIDISGFNVPGISIKFYQTTRQFTSTYIISYSNDGGNNWFDKEINDELVTNAGGVNRYKKVFLKNADLSSTDFRVKFRYEANYYYWIIDDVQIIETEANNLQVAPNGFYAIAPNAVTPISQVEPFSHLADIKNAGSITQTNTNLNVTIVDDATGNVVFTDDLIYGGDNGIEGDSLAENEPMTGYFTPDDATPTSYTGTYTISSDSADFDPSDNTVSYTFMTSDTVFAKETGGTGNFNPAATNWDDLEPHSAAYGNHFYVVNGDWDASSITFGIGNGEDPAMIGRVLSAYLYRWDIDDMEDGLAMDPLERTRVGFNFYEITGFETVNDLITLPLLNFPDGTPGPIDLESNSHYAVMIEYVTSDEVDFLMRESTAKDYNGMVFRSELDGIAAPDKKGRYAPLVGLNGDLESESYGTTGFGRNQVPVVRLNISLLVDTEDQLDVANILEISPNPTDDKINVNIDLLETQEKVNIRIFDITGRLLVDKYYSNFQKENLEFDVSKFANGSYFLHFISADGMRAEQFIVQH